jgi:predicted metalloendopeptidase
MEFQVGYSTSKPDTSSVISLSEYFSDVIIEKADFFGNMMKSNKHQVKQEIFKKDKNFDKNTWKQVNAQSVQVSYNKKLNKVSSCVLVLASSITNVQTQNLGYHTRWIVTITLY